MTTEKKRDKIVANFIDLLNTTLNSVGADKSDILLAHLGKLTDKMVEIDTAYDEMEDLQYQMNECEDSPEDSAEYNSLNTQSEYYAGSAFEHFDELIEMFTYDN